MKGILSVLIGNSIQKTYENYAFIYLFNTLCFMHWKHPEKYDVKITSSVFRDPFSAAATTPAFPLKCSPSHNRDGISDGVDTGFPSLTLKCNPIENNSV